MDDDGVTPLMAIASQGSLVGQTLIIDALKEDHVGGGAQKSH
jgi:hypothetical protein